MGPAWTRSAAAVVCGGRMALVRKAHHNGPRTSPGRRLGLPQLLTLCACAVPWGGARGGTAFLPQLADSVRWWNQRPAKMLSVAIPRNPSAPPLVTASPLGRPTILVVTLQASCCRFLKFLCTEPKSVLHLWHFPMSACGCVLLPPRSSVHPVHGSLPPVPAVWGHLGTCQPLPSPNYDGAGVRTSNLEH